MNEPRGGGEAFELRYDGQAAAHPAVTRAHLRLDLSETRLGLYDMSVSVRDPTSGIESLPLRTFVLVDRGRGH